jgi:hypothetical protein
VRGNARRVAGRVNVARPDCTGRSATRTGRCGASARIRNATGSREAEHAARAPDASARSPVRATRMKAAGTGKTIDCARAYVGAGCSR